MWATRKPICLSGPAGAEEFLLFRIPFTADLATTSGPTPLWEGQADNPPYTNVQVFTDPNNAVPLENVVMGVICSLSHPVLNVISMRTKHAIWLTSTRCLRKGIG